MQLSSRPTMVDILVCARGSQAEFFMSVLKGGGHSSVLAATANDAEAAARAGARLVVIDFESLAEERDEVWRRISEFTPPPRILIIASSRKPTDAGELFLRYRFTNLLARNQKIHEGDFRNTVDKILSANIFGMERYLSPGAKVVEQAIKGSAQKPELLDIVSEYATQAGVNRQAIQRVISVADEMLTNAVYDAPVGADGMPRYASWSRNQPVALEPHEEGTLRLGANAERFVLSVEDPFGGLTPEVVLSYLDKCFRRGPDQVDKKQGGAGLGLYFMFNTLSHFIINIEPGKRTEVIGVMDITANFREFASRSKSFNLFALGAVDG